MEPLVFQATELPEVPFDSRVAPTVDAAEEFRLAALARAPRQCGQLFADVLSSELVGRVYTEHVEEY